MSSIVSRSSSQDKPLEIQLRRDILPSDVAAVRAITTATDFFTAEEIDVAVELVEDRLQHGEKSEYQFIMADAQGKPVGFATYGPIPCTVGSYDLYWIAVHPEHGRGGVGRQLMEAAEQHIKAKGGRRVYVETSSRPQYEPTRRFYDRCGYRVDAVQDDFYSPGDGKVTLVKSIG